MKMKKIIVFLMLMGAVVAQAQKTFVVTPVSATPQHNDLLQFKTNIWIPRTLAQVASDMGLSISFDTSTIYATLGQKLRYIDSSSMLSAYRTALNNRLKISDTAAMLANYLNTADISAITADVANKPTLATLTSLRALSSPVLGMLYQTPDGGIWYYDSSDHSTPDNTGTVLLTGTKRFKRVFEGPIFPRWFNSAIVDGVTDASTAYQAAIDIASPLSATVDGEGKTYLVGTSLVLKSNVTLVNAKFTSGLPTISSPTTNATTILASTMFQAPVTIRSTSTSVNANINKGDSIITLTNTSNINVGDIVYIATTKSDPVITGTKFGLFKLVIGKTSTTLSLDGPAEDTLSTSTDNLTLTVFGPTTNLRIKDVTINLINNTRQSGLQLNYTTGARIENVTVIGGGNSYIGIGLNGFDGQINRSHTERFYDSVQNVYGYGFLLSGHNMKLLNSECYGAKHAIAGGDSRYTSTDFLYQGNYATDPGTAAFDAHSSVRGVKMINNVVRNRNGGGAAFWCRGRDCEISFNEMYDCPVGIKLIEVANTNQKITNNIIRGANYGIFAQLDSTTSGANIDISWNNIEANSFGLFHQYKFTIKILTEDHNTIKSNAYGISGLEGQDGSFSYNNIEYGATSFGGGIYFAAMAAPVTGKVSGAKINGNTLVNKSASGTSNIRMVGVALDNYQMVGNTLTNAFGSTVSYDGSFPSTGSNTIKDNLGYDYLTTLPTATVNFIGRTITLTNGNVDRKYIGVLTGSGTYGWQQTSLVQLSATPASGTWYLGDVVWNSAPATNGDVGWVCTVAGTPGTWVKIGKVGASVAASDVAAGTFPTGTFVFQGGVSMLSGIASLTGDISQVGGGFYIDRGNVRMRPFQAVTSYFSNNGSTSGVIVYNSGNIQAANISGNADITSAKFAVVSSTQGFLAPRQTTTARNAISSPVDGLLIADTTQHKYSFYNGSAWNYIAGENLSFNAQTGTTYTLVIGDASKLVTMSNASSNTLTVPPNSSVAFTVGTQITVASIAAGQTTIAAGGGVTINSSGGKLKLSNQYSSATLIKTATDTWLLIGDIAL